MKRPVVIPFTERRARKLFGITLFYTNQNLYEIGEEYEADLINGQTIVIPKGFVSDGATIPWAIRFIFSQMGIYFAACVVHDYLYFTRLFQSRLLTDIQFLYDMVKCGMNKAKAELFYLAVRLGGKRWWNI
jgi:hypothetical protein